MILKILTIAFVIIVLAKYVFNAKIHEKYFFGVAALLAIASNFGTKYSAIEMFDGSSVAFDKEAFENLNRVVNEIAGEGKLTIPGNLIVDGTCTVKGTSNLKDVVTLNMGLNVDGMTNLRNHVNVSQGKQLNCEFLGLHTDSKNKKCTLKVDKTSDSLILGTSSGLGTNVNNIKVIKKLTLKDTSTFEKDCTLNKKLTVKDTSTFEKDCTLNKKLTVKDISTFEKDCTLNKKLTVEGNCSLKGTLNVDGNGKFKEIMQANQVYINGTARDMSSTAGKLVFGTKNVYETGFRYRGNGLVDYDGRRDGF